jgi:hypothetical protein
MLSFLSEMQRVDGLDEPWLADLYAEFSEELPRPC